MDSIRQVSRGTAGFLTLALIAACAGGSDNPSRAGAPWVVVPPSQNAAAADAAIRRVELADIGNELGGLTLRQVQVDDPVYKRPKRYEGYPLAEVLRAAFGPLEDRDLELVFICSDGYLATLPLGKVDDRATVAVRDLDAPPSTRWEMVLQGRQQISPEPYYVVWQHAGAASGDSFPWPYRVVALELRSPHADAMGVPEGSPADVISGAQLFRAHCVRCHSMNLLGGTLGPELNVPANVTEYWNHEALRRFIVNPASVRAGSRMPAFPAFSPGDVDAVVGYLAFMKTRKIHVK